MAVFSTVSKIQDNDIHIEIVFPSKIYQIEN